MRYPASSHTTLPYLLPPQGMTNKIAAAKAKTMASGEPNTRDHNRLPGVRVETLVEVGESCKAASALRATDRDFLYKAGFQIGKPKGCSMLIAWYFKIKDRKQSVKPSQYVMRSRGRFTSCRSLSVYSTSSSFNSEEASPLSSAASAMEGLASESCSPDSISSSTEGSAR